MKRILILCMCLLFLSTKSFANTDVVLDKIIEKDCSNLSEKLTAEVYDKNPNLVIVNEKKESDIISALSFAYKNKAAILLIQNDGAYIKKESPILKEVNRLKAKNVYIIGGPKSVSEEISDNLKLSVCWFRELTGKIAQRYQRMSSKKILILTLPIRWFLAICLILILFRQRWDTI